MKFTRLSAFATHLGISLLIFLVLLGVVVFAWYRFPLFWVDNGWHGIKIIAGCDLVLGPLLTLIVFKPGKPRLKLDMSIIAAVQFAALTAGTYIVYLERPLMLVYADSYFMPIGGALRPDTLTDADIQRFDAQPYPLAMIDMPEDENQRQKIRARGLARGGLRLLQDLYIKPNDQYLRDLKRYSIDMVKLTSDDAEAKKVLDRFVARHGGVENHVFAPLYGRAGKSILALNRDDGSIVEALEIAPPKL